MSACLVRAVYAGLRKCFGSPFRAAPVRKRGGAPEENRSLTVAALLGRTPSKHFLTTLATRPGCAYLAAGLLLLVPGCHSSTSTPRVIFLEGAGWFGSSVSIRGGLRDGGYRGAFETFSWTSFLGAPADHLVASRSAVTAERLAQRITMIRRAQPGGRIHLMGLSAGTAVILNALERLPENVAVDHVVLLSASVSARRDLSPALEHVRGRLYATCSRHDRLLASLPLNADGTAGRSAGERGFELPDDLAESDTHHYAKVVNLPWEPSYAGFGWTGGHLRATDPRFVATVITPRLLVLEPFPLDRPVCPG